jgi:hypothetical protein
MTTPYGISRQNGTNSNSGGYLNAPVWGPLNTNKTPGQIPFMFQGTLFGRIQNPQQFYSMQEPPYANENTNARIQYRRTIVNTTGPSQQALLKLVKAQSPSMWRSRFSNNAIAYAVSTHQNYTEPLPSSLFTSQRKIIAVGKSAYNPNSEQYIANSTKNVDRSSVRSSIRRARSSGSVAPAKKGAIQNNSLNSTVGWGSIPRQNY